MVIVTAFILSEADSKHWIFKKSLANCQHLDLKISRQAFQRAKKWELLWMLDSICWMLDSFKLEAPLDSRIFGGISKKLPDIV